MTYKEDFESVNTDKVDEASAGENKADEKKEG